MQEVEELAELTSFASSVRPKDGSYDWDYSLVIRRENDRFYRANMALLLASGESRHHRAAHPAGHRRVPAGMTR